MSVLKLKSLGVIKYPQALVTSFSGRKGVAEITLKGSGKQLRIELCPDCVGTLVSLAQDLTYQQRNYAMNIWNKYLDMKKTTGYVPPNGEQ